MTAKGCSQPYSRTVILYLFSHTETHFRNCGVGEAGGWLCGCVAEETVGLRETGRWTGVVLRFFFAKETWCGEAGR